MWATRSLARRRRRRKKTREKCNGGSAINRAHSSKLPPVLQPFASASAKSWSREIDDEHVHICDKELISGVFLRTLCVYDGLTFSPESVKMQCFSVCCFFLHVSGICCCWKTRRERGGGEGGRGRGMGRRKKECRSKNV